MLKNISPKVELVFHGLRFILTYLVEDFISP